jgi:hypothetical protein
MQSNRIRERAIQASRVNGLGICDALRLTLEPAQIPWLTDEVEELRRAHEEAHALLGASPGASLANGSEESSAARYQLHLLQLVHEQLLDGAADENAVVVGPSMMLSDLVRGAMRHTIETLAELASSSRLRNHATQFALSEAAAAATAWVETYRDLQAVEAFNFDPEVDPVDRW